MIANIVIGIVAMSFIDQSFDLIATLVSDFVGAIRRAIRRLGPRI